MSITTDIRFYVGETVTIPDTVYIQGTNTPRPLAGLAFRFVIRVSQDETSSILIEKDTSGGGVVVSGTTTGLVTTTLLATDTGALTTGWYYYALAITTPGQEAVISDGRVNVKANPAIP